ncbi:MAG: hypothetical protein IRZ08_11890, partial [Frankia sp.]|nr:hypothetical protein [Frankia sp.]
MKTYGDIAALTAPGRRRLLARLRAVAPTVTDVTAEHLHFVDLADGPDGLGHDGERRLRSLLSYGEPFTGERTGRRLVVLPRPGTISPWSSKASDIAASAGLRGIHRIERGTVYYLAGPPPAPPPRAGRPGAAPA